MVFTVVGISGGISLFHSFFMDESSSPFNISNNIIDDFLLCPVVRQPELVAGGILGHSNIIIRTRLDYYSRKMI